MVKDIEVYFDMTMRQKATFECLRAPHAQDFLLAIPIDELGKNMSTVEYRTILMYRLMILLFLVDAICPVCRKTCLDSFGEHAVHCKELLGFIYRHAMVRDILFDIFRCAQISAKKEAPRNFLTDPRMEDPHSDQLTFCGSLDGSGEFSGESVCNFIDDSLIPKLDAPTRWMKSIPIKVNILAWKICLDRLPTRLNLSSRGLKIPSTLCPL
nr:auxilin-like protein [Tanacetum cinerariifolium]